MYFKRDAMHLNTMAAIIKLHILDKIFCIT